jgi:hypothetical protein
MEYIFDCPKCGKKIVMTLENPKSCTCTPTKRPVWVRLVSVCKSSEDIGVGDTIKRIAAEIGGERFKVWAKQCGIPCGCTERQEILNEKYPYE